MAKSKRLKKIEETEHDRLIHDLELAAERLEESTKSVEALKKADAKRRKRSDAKG